jgi:hypothetical protein
MMRKIQDLTGRVFGRLTVLGRGADRPTPNGLREIRWRCLCVCGGTTEAIKANLTHGRTQSCGCLRQELLAVGRVTHGMGADGRYPIWFAMKDRCLCETDPAYDRYGGRGITVCDRWLNDFPAFCADMGERPAGLTIERIDNNGNYEPGNCRWATMKEQSRNRRNNHMITHAGLTLCLAEWAERTAINYGTLRSRIARYGWSVERALEHYQLPVI